MKFSNLAMVKILNKLEPVCCKKQQEKFLTKYWFAEQGISEGPRLFQTDCIQVKVIPLIIQNLQSSPFSQTS